MSGVSPKKLGQMQQSLDDLLVRLQTIKDPALLRDLETQHVALTQVLQDVTDYPKNVKKLNSFNSKFTKFETTIAGGGGKPAAVKAPRKKRPAVVAEPPVFDPSTYVGSGEIPVPKAAAVVDEGVMLTKGMEGEFYYLRGVERSGKDVVVHRTVLHVAPGETVESKAIAFLKSKNVDINESDYFLNPDQLDNPTLKLNDPVSAEQMARGLEAKQNVAVKAAKKAKAPVESRPTEWITQTELNKYDAGRVAEKKALIADAKEGRAGSFTQNKDGTKKAIKPEGAIDAPALEAKRLRESGLNKASEELKVIVNSGSTGALGETRNHKAAFQAFLDGKSGAYPVETKVPELAPNEEALKKVPDAQKKAHARLLKKNADAHQVAVDAWNAKRAEAQGVIESRLAMVDTEAAKALSAAQQAKLVEAKKLLQSGNFEEAHKRFQAIPIGDASKAPVRPGRRAISAEARTSVGEVYNDRWMDPESLTKRESWRKALMLEKNKWQTLRELRVKYFFETGAFNSALDSEGEFVNQFEDFVTKHPKEWNAIRTNNRVMDHLQWMGSNNAIALKTANSPRWGTSVKEPLSIALRKVTEGNFENIEETITKFNEGNKSFRIRSGKNLSPEFRSPSKNAASQVNREEFAAKKRRANLVETVETKTSDGIRKTMKPLQAQIDGGKLGPEALRKAKGQVAALQKQLDIAVDRDARAADTRSGVAKAEGAVAGETVVLKAPVNTDEVQLAKAEKRLKFLIDKSRNPDSPKRKLTKGEVAKLRGPLEETVEKLKRKIDEAADVAKAALVPPVVPPVVPGPVVPPVEPPLVTPVEPVVPPKVPNVVDDVAGKVGKAGKFMRVLGPLFAIYGAYEVMNMLKGVSTDDADEKRLKALQSLGAVSGANQQGLQDQQQLSQAQSAVDVAGIQHQNYLAEQNNQYTGNQAMDALLRGQRASLAGLAIPSRPSMAEVMARMQ